MKKQSWAIVAGLMLLLAAIPAWAHHAFASEFDAAKPIKVKGTVVKWELINPHSWLTISAKDDDGSDVTWRFEGPPPINLFRLGFTKDSLPAGTVVIVEGYAAKDGSKRASEKNVTFPDGKTLLMGLPDPEAKPAQK
jgi:hypothetical protein